MSVSGSALTISKSFLAGSVSVPGLVRLWATQVLRRPTSRSVAMSSTWLPSARRSTLASTGIVFLRFDDALKQLQLAKQIVLADHQFHAADTSWTGAEP